MITYGEGKLYFINDEINFDVTNAEVSLTPDEMTINIEAIESRKKKIGYLPEIEKVIYNSPATIVIWADGTKTIVKKQPGEYYDGEKGLAMCIAKKALGNTSKYYETFKKYDRNKTIKCCSTCVHKHLWASDLPCKGCFGFEHYERRDRR